MISSSLGWRPPSRRWRIPAWVAQTDEDKYRTGVLIGSGIGGLTGIEDAAILVHEKGPRRLSPFSSPAG